MITFEASSLEDIAKHFDDMAERAAETAIRAVTHKGKATNNAESRTWTRAAEMLRATTLKPKTETTNAA